jgi:hypothetical protein
MPPRLTRRSASKASRDHSRNQSERLGLPAATCSHQRSQRKAGRLPVRTKAIRSSASPSPSRELTRLDKDAHRPRQAADNEKAPDRAGRGPQSQCWRGPDLNRRPLRYEAVEHHLAHLMRLTPRGLAGSTHPTPCVRLTRTATSEQPRNQTRDQTLAPCPLRPPSYGRGCPRSPSRRSGRVADRLWRFVEGCRAPGPLRTTVTSAP